MTIPSATRVLEIWETDASPVATGLALLAAAGLDARRYPVGMFDEQLLRLRRGLFGGTMNASATCPSCGDRLDLEFDSASVLPPAHPPVANDLEIDVDGYRVSFHVPQASDAADAAACRDANEARRVLLNRCVTKAGHHGEDVSADHLPEGVCRAIAARMEEAHPQGDPAIVIACPSCKQTWDAQLDVPAFIEREIDTWALRVLADVHVLASRYGWSERRILALSPRRRRLYREMGDA